MDMLEGLCVAAVYPAGAGAASVTTRSVTVGQGWPLARDLDATVAAGNSLVSIYPMASSTSANDTPIGSSYVSAPPSAGCTVTADGLGGVTFGGAPVLGDIAVVVAEGKPYAYPVQAGDTVAVVVATLVRLLAADYPDAAATNGVITVPSAYSLTAAVSGAGTLVNKLHRQRTQFQVVVWSPTAADRTSVASAVDVAVKAQVRVPLPDTSSALLSYQGTNLSDKEENEGVFRRDVIVNVVYETIQAVPAQEVVAPLVTASGAYYNGG